MENKDRDEFFETLIETNRTLIEYFINWQDITQQHLKFQLDLHAMDAFIGCKTEEEINKIVDDFFSKGWERIFDNVLEKICTINDNDDRKYFDIDLFLESNDFIKQYSFNESNEVKTFLKKVDFLSLLNNITNFNDYFFGVICGLETPKRKQRSNDIMRKITFKLLDFYNVEIIDDNADGKVIVEINSEQIILDIAFANNEGGNFPAKISRAKEYVKNNLDKNIIQLWDGKGMNSKKIDANVWSELNIMNLFQLRNLLESQNNGRTSR